MSLIAHNLVEIEIGHKAFHLLDQIDTSLVYLSATDQTDQSNHNKNFIHILFAALKQIKLVLNIMLFLYWNDRGTSFICLYLSRLML